MCRGARPETYVTSRLFPSSPDFPSSGPGNFWLQGGSADAAFTFFHGLGVAADLTLGHASNISAGVDVSTMALMEGAPLHLPHRHEA